MLRRTFLKQGAAAVGATAFFDLGAAAQAASVAGKSTVYFTPDISVEGLRKLYAKINGDITGRVAIKLHTGEPHGLESEFLGLKAWCPKGLAILATRLDAPVLPACILRQEDGRFVIRVEAPIEVPAALGKGRAESGPLSREELESHVKLCNRVMEGWIRSYPEQYLWLHKRFKNLIDYRSRLPWEL